MNMDLICKTYIRLIELPWNTYSKKELKNGQALDQIDNVYDDIILREYNLNYTMELWSDEC